MRLVLAGAAAVAALAHVPVIGPHLDEAPYMGVLFVVLTAACAFLALAALVRGGRAVYALTVLTCGLAVLGYVATRLVAFPMLADDVGNWLEPLGVVSIVSESIAVGPRSSGCAGRRRRRSGLTGLASPASGPPASRRNGTRWLMTAGRGDGDGGAGRGARPGPDRPGVTVTPSTQPATVAVPRSFIAFLLTTVFFLVLGAYVLASRRRARRASVEG